MVPRRVVLRGAFAMGLLGAAGALTGCGDDGATAGGAAPAADLGTSPDVAGTTRPSATSTPRTKSDVYQRGPEERPVRTTAPSSAPEPTSVATGEPTVGARGGDNLATAREPKATPVSQPTETPTPTPAPLPPGAFARTSEIPVGGGKTFEAEKIVVTQPKPGQYFGFDATCTHAGCLVNKVEYGQIVCPCHGSKFSIANGRPEEGPALLPLPGKPILVAADGSISKA